MSMDQTPNKSVSRSFTELVVWKKMRQLKIKVQKIAKDFPS